MPVVVINNPPVRTPPSQIISEDRPPGTPRPRGTSALASRGIPLGALLLTLLLAPLALPPLSPLLPLPFGASSVRAQELLSPPDSPPAAEKEAETEDVFTARVLPIFREHCFKCHSHESGKSKGGLLLDSGAAVLVGADSGPIVLTGKPPGESPLLRVLRSTDPEVQMPPKGERLPEESLRTIEAWIASGAPIASLPTPASASPPGSAQIPLGPVKRSSSKITEADRQWWAFVPVRSQMVPEPAFESTPPHPVDRFLDARLAREGLTPAPEASRAALLRRVTFALTGLPPSLAELRAFLEDSSPEAFEHVVDRLLSSPRYGERMDRVWMDLARYADSDGYRIDDYRPTAWRYRDYLIQAFNSNKPYDRFVQEQLAGDELFPEDPQALTATGFLQMGIYEYNNRDARGQWETMLNDLTDTTADVFLGLGLQCARCHDHKFDPLLQRDYYA
ncbi:MAG: hypothetical protein RLZZ142_1522, partial [Verrucomicrobiota bacterium]